MKKYVFKPYSQNFPKLFEEEKQRIIDGIKEDITIEHIGSTAVPNLGGKGIIDIAIAVIKEKIDLVSKHLQKLGYIFSPTGSTEDRLFFSIDLPDPEEKIRRYHIHLTYSESKDWKDMISFRDYLRKHPEEIGKYEKVKKRAVKWANGDGAIYRKIKEPTFKSILTKILQDQRLQ